MGMFDFLLTNDNELNFVLIGVIVLIMIVVVVFLFILLIGKDMPKTTSRTSTTSNNRTTGAPTNNSNTNLSAANNNLTQNLVNNNIRQQEETMGEQVFHINDNVFTYDDAEAVCKAYGAELATYEQLVDAYKKGANWCSYGWTKGQLALYPVQKDFWDKVQENDEGRKDMCGDSPGINGGYFENGALQFGVNCFGKKRAPKGDERIKNAFVSDKERELRQKIALFRRQKGNFTLAPFNEEKWGTCGN